MILKLSEIKEQLRIDSSDQDAELRRMGAAADDYVNKYLGVATAYTADTVPDSVKQALLLLVADFNEIREGSVVGSTQSSISENPAVNNLLHFYREGLGV